MQNLITVNYVVRNGEKYIRLFLDSLKNQTFKNFQVHILDNNSTDNTRKIIKEEYSEFILHENKENIGAWAGFEKLLNSKVELLGISSTSEYVVFMTDVILKEDFLEKAVEIMEANSDYGALQAKVYQMELYSHNTNCQLLTTIDTCGFKIFKSRKVINLGQGEEDSGQFDNIGEIFGVEGVAPIFRRKALESCYITPLRSSTPEWLIDPDYRVGPLGYGDDLDLAWRMRLFGWKQIFAPNVIAYHDRSTTKGYSKSLKNYFERVEKRRKIDPLKRRLDWRNVRFTIIKNDYIINVLKDLPYILAREIGVLGYTILFEPEILFEIGNFMKYLPKMIKNRKTIMQQAKLSPDEMRKWFE